MDLLPSRGRTPDWVGRPERRIGAVDFLTVLPLAFVMNAGPQIVSAIFLATSQNARRNSIAFLLGVTIATTAGTTIAFLLIEAFGSDDPSARTSENSPIDYAIIALLLFLVLRVYLRRNVTEPPGRMGKLQSATPRFSFKLGLLLYSLMPTDIITMLSVAGYLARRDAPLWQALPFIGATVLLAAIPLLILLLMGERAEIVLPKMRNWMTTNAWVVNEVVIVFFLVISISGLE
jgi:threonine/homoserine/homoserine lactone efflux protein